MLYFIKFSFLITFSLLISHASAQQKTRTERTGVMRKIPGGTNFTHKEDKAMTKDEKPTAGKNKNATKAETRPATKAAMKRDNKAKPKKDIKAVNKGENTMKKEQKKNIKPVKPVEKNK